MRALFALAALLGTTVAALSSTLSAQEFTRWVLWMRHEQVGPAWDRVRHAEILAATGNAGRYQHRDGRPWDLRDHLPADPWAPPAPPPPAAAGITPAQRRAQHEEWLKLQEALL